MSLNDISLTSGMRSNLVSLQSTVTLLDRTQQRLASGKKVNSALDNPINYFAAQGHMSRAADIAGFKDNMSEAVQTIQTANQGITSLQGLIEAARSLGQSALSANPNQVGFTVNATVSGSVVTVGGQAFTAVNTGASDATHFNVQDKDGIALSTDEIASNLAVKINANVETGVGGDIKAINNGSRITLQSVAVDKAITGVAVVTGGTLTIDTELTSERKALALQYENLLTQIDTLSSTAGYKGNNLLANDTLSVRFEGGSLTVKGFNATASDLTVNTTGLANDDTYANNKWAVAADIKSDLINIDKGIAKVKQEASNLSSALSVINIQQDFSTQKINLLTKGADQLTAADTNEEGANMLMLQTRQSLGTTALSLSSQAAQSVLRLFA
jgi:flagellin-like hook-associated protein FlgL